MAVDGNTPSGTRWRCRINPRVIREDDNTAVVRNDIAWVADPWGYDVYGSKAGCSVNNYANQTGMVTFHAYAATGQAAEIWVTGCETTVNKTNVSQSIYCEGSVVLSGGYHNGTSHAEAYVTVGARPYHAHGNPTINVDDSSAYFGQEITVSWAKASNQGNASFDHFELYYEYPVGSGNLSKALYSGTGTTYKTIPSDITGAKGGQVKFVIKEVHEWYGTYPSTQSSILIDVVGGIVNVYDSSGNKRIGLVNVYDSNGILRTGLIYVYDSSGNLHNTG